MRIEAAKHGVQGLPITPSVLASLRETARLFSTHYSTRIEGNRLTQEQVSKVIEDKQHFPGRERDEKEVLGYYAALEKLEQLAASGSAVSETHIQALHALVMAEGRKKAKPTPYRDGQNVIRDSRSRGLVYMPPEAKDVPTLMKEMVAWIASTERKELPCPILPPGSRITSSPPSTRITMATDGRCVTAYHAHSAFRRVWSERLIFVGRILRPKFGRILMKRLPSARRIIITKAVPKPTSRNG